MAGLQALIKLVLPKDRLFFKLFTAAGENIKTMGNLLSQLVAEPNAENRMHINQQIEELEHQNDEITHQIFIELGRNFITPFGREDIHYLASALDDVADFINAVSRNIDLHKIDPTEDGIRKMAEVISQTTTELANVVVQLKLLKKPQLILESLKKVNSLDNHAEDVFDMCIQRLFETEDDFKKLIQKREIFNLMEETSDKCKEAAHVLKSIIIKSA